MKKILVVFTGGTIGSIADAGVINTSEKAGFKLIQLFEKSHSQKITLDCIQPLQLLSENLFPTVWKTLIEAIEAQPLDDYLGIIVTHGTDTLAFTAAALGLYFNSLKKPLLIVSSDYPLENPRANGLVNFNCAVEFICQQQQNGVFVPYQNQGQAMQIHIATRLASSLQLSSDFISVQSQPYLEFKQNDFYAPNGFISNSNKNIALKTNFSTHILLIKPYPSLDYSQFNLDKVDVVLHDLYHSGTACTSDTWGERHNLLFFLQRCQQKNIPCYLAPAIKSTETYYSTVELEKYGAEMLWNLSLETVYVKLLFAYATFNSVDEITDFMESDIALEHLSGD